MNRNVKWENSILKYIEDNYTKEQVERIKILNSKYGIDLSKISKGSERKIRMICIKEEYHNFDRDGNEVGYETSCYNFSKRGVRCGYCNSFASKKVHWKDSFAQWGIDNIDKEFLEKYWSNKNILNPWELSPKSGKKVWMYCLKKEYHNDNDGYEVSCKHFAEGNRCPYCSSKKIHYKDSLGYLYPNKSKMIAIPENNLVIEDTFSIAPKSHKKYYIKCNDCEKISRKRKSLSYMINKDYLCEYCSDGLPITEKFTANILEQLNIKFIFQLNKNTYEWCENSRYDFYLKDYNMIIETHGEQHYKNKSNGSNWNSLEYEQENDENKRKLALNNGIKHYIVIDMRKSEYEYIRNNIIEKLSPYFDLSNVKWKLAWEESQKSLCVKSWNLWNDGYSIPEISDMLNLSRRTILTYLKNGVKIGQCDYTTEESYKRNLGKRIGKNHYRAKKVICITTKRIFNTLKEGADYYNIKYSITIVNCCKLNRKSAGTYQGQKLVWRYLLLGSKTYRIKNKYKKLV